MGVSLILSFFPLSSEKTTGSPPSIINCVHIFGLVKKCISFQNTVSFYIRSDNTRYQIKSKLTAFKHNDTTIIRDTFTPQI